MNKVSAVFLAGVLSVSLLAGCGSTEEDGENNTEISSFSVSGSESVELSDLSDYASDYYVEITDDLGRRVELRRPPQRVAVLNGSFAETWILAGGEITSVVKDAWEDYDLDLPEDVVNLGSTKDINLELIFDTEPDLVIASANSKSHKDALETFDNAKVPVLYFDVNNFEDYLRMLDACTDITGRKDLFETNGTAIQTQVNAAKTAAQARLDAMDNPPKVLLIRAAASGVHAKGSEGTVAGEMLSDLGACNIADGSDLLEDLSLEKIIEEDPDYIFIVQQGDDTEGMQKLLDETLMNNPAWSGLTAVKEGRLFYLDKKLFHFKPNNRWGTAYEELEKLLYED